LSFQRAELASLAFNGADWDVLQADYARLAHAASLLDTAAFGIEILSDADTACLSQVNALMARLRDGLVHDAALGEPLQLLDSAQAELQEAVYSLRHYQQRLDTDPQQLLEKEQKIQAVMDMARKYRVPPERLDEVLQGVVARLAELGGDIDLEQLMRQEQAAQQAYRDVAGKLSAARGLSAEKLSLQITQAMQTLAMQGGSFAVVLLPLPEGSASGLETVEFQVAANPGTPTRSMANYHVSVWRFRLPPVRLPACRR
jgi:DNA repair protein RecN (Recombination protein N)